MRPNLIFDWESILTWNSISQDAKTNASVAKFVREKLDSAGLNECENICGSWNSKIVDPSISKNASVIGANLISWQNSSVSKAMYDTCWAGVDYSLFGLTINLPTIPSYGYYVIKAFNVLYRLGFQVETESDDNDVYALSAASFDKVAMMIVNNSDQEKEIEIKTQDVKRIKSAVTIIKEVETEGLSYEEKNNIILPRKVLGALKFVMKPNEVRLYEFE